MLPQTLGVHQSRIQFTGYLSANPAGVWPNAAQRNAKCGAMWRARRGSEKYRMVEGALSLEGHKNYVTKSMPDEYDEPQRYRQATTIWVCVK